MTPTPSSSNDAASLREEIIEKFEVAWRSGGRPALEAFVPQASSDPRLLRELVHADLEFRLKAGEPARTEEYLARFPILRAERDGLLDLLGWEYQLRRRLEPRLTRADFSARFPELREELEHILPASGTAPEDGAPRSSKETVREERSESANESTLRPGSSEAAVGTLAVGSTSIPGYEVVALLGRGGMGVVYQARQLSLRRFVALKMLRPDALATSEERTRFRAEAEAAARLKHPNIVQVYEVGVHAGRPYFAMEHVAGGSLADRLAGTPLPPLEAAALVETLARAVHAAHVAGVIHRDLKPANVLLDSGRLVAGRLVDGEAAADDQAQATSRQAPTPKITDFGLAKQLDADQQHTQTGVILGTPSYMAPEQAAGKVRELGPLVDVYALGAILYETLTGRPPFRGASTLDTLEQVRSQEPVAPSRLQPRVPRDLDVICLKCLEKDPARRYASAEALAEDLRRVVSGEPIIARPTPAWERALKWTRRRPAVAALTAAVVVVALMGLGGIVWQWRESVHARERAEWGAYVATARLAQAEYFANKPQRVRELLDKARPVHLRGWEWGFVNQILHSEERLWNAHADGVTAMAVGGDRRQLATAGRDGAVKLWSLPDGGAGAAWQAHRSLVRSLALSRDGRFLVTAAGPEGAKLWDVAGPRELFSFKHPEEFAVVVALNPEATQFAVGTQRGSILVLEVPSGRQLHHLKSRIGPLHTLAYSADGALLAAGGAPRSNPFSTTPLTYRGLVQVWKAGAGEELRTIQAPSQAVTALDFHPKGELLTAGMEYGMMQHWKVQTGSEWKTDWENDGDILSVAHGKDGGWIASSCTRGMIFLLDRRENLHPPIAHEIRAHVGPITGVAFLENDERFVSAGLDGTVRVWRTAVAQNNQTIRCNLGQDLNTLALSPDGTLVASGGAEGKVRIWHTRTGEEFAAFDMGCGEVRCVAFSPDGTLLAVVGDTPEMQLLHVQEKRIGLKTSVEQAALKQIAFSAEGTHIFAIASKDPGGVLLAWPFHSSAAPRLIPITGALIDAALAVSPVDGRVVTGTSDGTVIVWNADCTKQLHVLPHEQSIRSLAVSPDGRLLAVGTGSTRSGGEGLVHFYDLARGQELRSVPGHVDGVLGLSFSPDGKRLASVGSEPALKLIDVVTGDEVLAIPNLYELGPLTAAQFSRDGLLLATAHTEGVIKLLRATSWHRD